MKTLKKFLCLALLFAAFCQIFPDAPAVRPAGIPGTEKIDIAY